MQQLNSIELSKISGSLFEVNIISGSQCDPTYCDCSGPYNFTSSHGSDMMFGLKIPMVDSSHCSILCGCHINQMSDF